MSSDGQWTSVSLPYVTGEPGDAWAAEAKAHGGKGTQRLVTVDTQPAPEAVASALKLQPGEQVVVRSRVILLDDHPVELVDSYYPASIARDSRLAETTKDSRRRRRPPGISGLPVSASGRRRHRTPGNPGGGRGVRTEASGGGGRALPSDPLRQRPAGRGQRHDLAGRSPQTALRNHSVNHRTRAGAGHAPRN